MSSAISFLTIKMPRKITKLIHPFIILLSVATIVFVGPYLFYTINFMGKVFPNTYVYGINIGGLTPTDAVNLLAKQNQDSSVIHIISKTKTYDFKTSGISLNYDYSESVNRAYNLTRTGNFFLDTFERLSLIKYPKKLGLIVTYDDIKLSDFISSLSKENSVNPVYPSIKIEGGGVEITKGASGVVLDEQKLKLLLGQNFSFQSTNDINLPAKVIDPTLNGQEISSAKTRAEKYLGKNMSFKFESKTYNLTDVDLVGFVDPKSDYNDAEVNSQIAKIRNDINRDPQNAKFEFDKNRVTEFAPALNGIKLNTEKFRTLLVTNLDHLANSADKSISFDIPVVTTKPLVATEDVNSLGIKELIGEATSTYFHSIPGRVFNVGLAASRINGTLVAPGETFSFNQILGDVSKFTGYKEAYVISGGKTVLGDGGGVCQVSTTLFRSVLNAGLPVDQRSAHAYRVGYYEQNSPPGFDATVYSPAPDFKFTNDTANHILIQTKNDPTNYSLVFELYGTRDGRVATISKPVISNYAPALPTVYQDDPTLPVGTLKQTDFAAAGARVTFNYSVSRNNEQTYQKTFVSNYRPWAAIFLRGTKI